MGFFDLKWIVEIEYSDGFLSSNKKDTVIVDAKNDYEAKQKLKKIRNSLINTFGYVQLNNTIRIPK